MTFCQKPSKRLFFEEIRRRIPNTKVFYTHDNGYQYGLESIVDWSRPWLAIGIDFGEDKGVFPAIAMGKIKPMLFQIEVGLRRHPQRTNVDGNSLWYRNNPIVNVIAQGEVAKKTDELCNSLLNLTRAFC